MALASLTFFNYLATDHQGNPIPAPKLPAVSVDNITFTTTTAGAAIPQAAYVQIAVTVGCHFTIAASPTATTSHQWLPANAVVIMGLDSNLIGQKFAFVDDGI